MPSNWTSAFSAEARFDYIKLTFPDVHPIHRNNVDMAISAAYGRVCQELSERRPKLPKMTTLEPSINKPNGKYIVEAFGVAAELVHYLPAGWAQYLTYVHVKSFFHNREGRGIPEIKELYENTQGPRSFSCVYPGTMSRSDKGNKLPSLRSGSRKSGSHGIWYQRTGQPIGGEVRFRDEQVKDMTLDALDFWQSQKMNDEAFWGMLLWQFARKGGEFFERDFSARGENVYDWLLPADYDNARVDCKDYIFENFRRELLQPELGRENDYEA